MSKPRQKKRPGGGGNMSAISRDKLFSISVKLVPTGEIFTLKNVHNDMRISELKHLAEYSTGIPQHIQRLCYLDEGDLQDHTDVRYNDIVAGAVLHMSVWHVWKTLVEAAASNDTDYLFKLGVTLDTDFRTPNSEYMGPEAKKDWVAERAFTALYIAAHRGYVKTAARLIDAGADVNGLTGLGQTPLHVAAANGHGTVVDLLLEKGADIDAVDQYGESALAVASRFGHKACERHLFLFRWQQRAKNIKPHIQHEMFAHQYFDSAFPVWLKGDHAQVYFTQILPPGEFEGTGMNAPRHMAAGECSGTPEEEAMDTNIPTTGGEGLPRIGKMSPICEESSSVGGSHRETNVTIQKLPPSASLRRSRRRPGSLSEKAASSFEEWLNSKKSSEQKFLDIQKLEDEVKKRQEEDTCDKAPDSPMQRRQLLKKRQQDFLELKKRQEDYKEKSYEEWLAAKETKPGAGRRAAANKPGGSGLAGADTSGAGNLGDALLIPGGDTSIIAAAKKRSKTPQTTTDIIHQILQRREEEGKSKPSVEMWYQERDDSLMEEIRLGRTALQRRLPANVL